MDRPRSVPTKMSYGTLAPLNSQRRALPHRCGRLRLRKELPLVSRIFQGRASRKSKLSRIDGYDGTQRPARLGKPQKAEARAVPAPGPTTNYEFPLLGWPKLYVGCIPLRLAKGGFGRELTASPLVGLFFPACRRPHPISCDSQAPCKADTGNRDWRRLTGSADDPFGPALSRSGPGALRGSRPV